MAVDRNEFPIEIFPDEFQNIIRHTNTVNNFDINASCVSYLSSVATCIGSNLTVNIDIGYSARPIFWFAIVSKSGTSKSHNLKFPFSYLKEQDKER